MSELFTYLQKHEAQFRRLFIHWYGISQGIADHIPRARLASLYSDFTQQRTHNPDGYASNITAWVTGLAHATKAGVVPGGPDLLSLRTGDALLQALETKEWGRPLALDAVIVGGRIFQQSLRAVSNCHTFRTKLLHEDR